MGAIYFDFKIQFNGDEKAKKQALDYIEEYSGYEELKDGSYSNSWLEGDDIDDCALDFAIGVIQASPDVEFVMTSTVDTSESAGEYMDYEFKYSDHILKYRSSDWYIYYNADNYACEHEDNDEEDEGEIKYTAEELEKFSEGEWFILDSGYGRIVNKVPLDPEYESMDLDEIMEYEASEDDDEDDDE